MFQFLDLRSLAQDENEGVREADNNFKGAVKGPQTVGPSAVGDHKKIGRGTVKFGYSLVERSSYKSNFGEIVCKSSRSASQSS